MHLAKNKPMIAAIIVIIFLMASVTLMAFPVQAKLR